MQNSHRTYEQRLDILGRPEVLETLSGIMHGIERESLRINANGTLAGTDHPKALGSALTHETITTDFSEYLMEFITPPEDSIETSVAQLWDIHKYVIETIGEERLWPVSMPCFIDNEDDIRIAQYGDSNVGRMKSLYRTGLKNRYGSMMQAIAGVHFNFSLPERFWHNWFLGLCGENSCQRMISADYFHLIRNYRRMCWLIPYLYGASPALCGSFLKGKEHKLPFEKTPNGTLYLPHATSLRMSDLGYTNNAQSSLAICYNDIDSYIQSVRGAINSPSEEYQRFAGLKDGQYQQLNANILQIENELYSPIRPKQPAVSLETPSEALERRGVSYIEVRALDLNPFSPIGIETQQFYFLDVFLLYCLVLESPELGRDAFAEAEDNVKQVVLYGRAPDVSLQNNGQDHALKDWASQIFEQMKPIAALLDRANNTDQYSQALAQEARKVEDPSLTPSGQMLANIVEGDLGNGSYAVNLAEQYRTAFMDHQYQVSDHGLFEARAQQSILEQQQLEASDTLSFEDFLEKMFPAG